MLLHRIDLEYPVQSLPRYGYGKPVHARIAEILGRHRVLYSRTIGELMLHLDGFAFERNDFLAPLDAFALYGMLALHRPAIYLEVGSGESTKYARLSIEQHGLPTKLVSIDPTPRAEIDAICDQVIRQPLEILELDIFSELRAGDMLFIDGSHRVLMNSDVVVTFLDVLPRLPTGALLHLHDIFLPADYPAEWAERGYSEQYVLAAYLMGGGARLAPVFPGAYISQDPELSRGLAPLWERFPQLDRGGGVSFWAEMK